ncbi:MAG: ModE family transcriptional regulator [Hydrogenophilales bacterium CG17_big_fil_post_rev_8_21_14_2_50_63_12]|nr:MAG: ModE family transcriptional regulator [Hydrogenophilales bacterium CG17_big_fil_post_rev_8_21_14_2_50_63_12]PIX96611.1 MAG: ModE family transcriptional regulator [Hydrogenophilales bacterium CG_4_10_14_3_um_filter_63_21]PJB03432.1 MAG: ModE family transcriptional regulator [Hydrogenophilales bacterium CG_4_9_14_3_um_filter_63_34]
MPTQPLVRILFPAPLNLGPGKIRLMEAIHGTGSLSGAARQLHISYRRAWDMLDSLNRNCPLPLVETAAGGVRGGGARLTAEGAKLLVRYRKLEASVMALVTADATDLVKMFET